MALLSLADVDEGEALVDVDCSVGLFVLGDGEAGTGVASVLLRLLFRAAVADFGDASGVPDRLSASCSCM